MPEAILAIDAGTTSVRTLIFSGEGRLLAKARRAFALRYPAPGRVEQDAEGLWQDTMATIGEALGAARLQPRDIAAIGMTAQRSSLIVWERTSARPLSPLVSWQDTRGAAPAKELQAAGFLVLPQTSAAKLEAVLGAVEGARGRAERGEIVVGNVDSYLLARLTGGARHVTDASQACTTGLFDYFASDWDKKLLAHLRLPVALMPAIVDTFGALGETAGGVFGAAVPIAANIADQQAALIGEGASAKGEAKLTLGTSGTLDVHTGTDVLMAEGAYPLVALRKDGASEMCIEGMVITAGAVFEWLVNGLGLAPSLEALAGLALRARADSGVAFLPALQGLGTPHGRPDAQGLLAGLTRGTSRADIARAAIEGVAFRIAEVTDHVFGKTGLARPAMLSVDGGASANDALLAAIADATGLVVARPTLLDATALGAAVLAGMGAGLWPRAIAKRLAEPERIFEARWSEDERLTRRAEWAQRVGLTP